MGTHLVVNMPTVGACCENIQVHSTDPNFSHSKYLGTFTLHLDESGDAIANNDAAIFISTNSKPKLYVHRSQDPDRESFIQECPCQTRLWQKMGEDNKWATDKTLKVMIRQAQKLI